MAGKLSGTSNYFVKSASQQRGETEEAETRYHPLLDPVFQRWMSDDYICAEFLEALTGRDIGSLRIETQYEIIQPGLDLRKIRLDVKATEEEFQIFNIEAQKQYYKDHYDRTLYYACMQISRQLKQGDTFDKLKKTTVIFINMDNKDSPYFIESASVIRDQDFTVFNDKLHIININLNNIAKAESNVSDKLMFFALFCLVGHHEDVLNTACLDRNLQFKGLQDTLVLKLKEISGDITMYDVIQMYRSLYKDAEEVLPVDLIDKIKADGKAEGEMLGKIKAYNEMGLTSEEIAKKTGLTLTAVIAILNTSAV